MGCCFACCPLFHLTIDLVSLLLLPCGIDALLRWCCAKRAASISSLFSRCMLLQLPARDWLVCSPVLLQRHNPLTAVLAVLQVLGGAGPAITAVPLTVVWAGTSALSLLNSIRTRQVGPVGAFQRVGFVLFTGMGQILSSFSRIAAAVLTLIPPNRAGHLSDRGMLTRAVSVRGSDRPKLISEART